MPKQDQATQAETARENEHVATTLSQPIRVRRGTCKERCGDEGGSPDHNLRRSGPHGEDADGKGKSEGESRKRKDKVDKRKVYIRLTAAGKKMRELALKAVFSLERSIVKDIPEKKLKTFFEVINHVPEAIKEFKENIALK